MKTNSVLFVDDEPHIITALKRILKDEPYTRYFAESGDCAMEIIHKNDLNLLVTDLKMPGIDGLTLLRKVMKKYPHIIRIVLSVISDSNKIITALNEGNIYRYILKPWNEVELKIVIKQALDLCNLQRDKSVLIQRLQEQNKYLEQIIEQRNIYITSIANNAEIGKHSSQLVHNLKTPLNGIVGATSLLELSLSDQTHDQNTALKYIETLKTSTDKLEKMISGIMVKAGNSKYIIDEDIDINKILKEEHDFFNIHQEYQYNITKKFELHEKLPFLKGNPYHFRQIIDNLIKNSIDAMENTEKKIICYKTDIYKKNIRIQISDTGIGISKKNLKYIFSPEFTTKPVGKGTGLGMASVKAMMDEYSGEIQINSIENQGTEVTLLFPYEVNYANTDS